MIDEGAWTRWALLAARVERDLDPILIDTGIDVIDSDHRVLLRHVLRLNRMLEDEARDGVDETSIAAQAALIESLRSYSAYHFEREEALAERLGAPGLERQKREHASIVRTLVEAAADFAAGRITVPADLRAPVFSWIAHHIAESDRESFRIEVLLPALARATSWQDLAEVVRTTGIDILDLEHRRIVEDIISVSREMAAGDLAGCMPALARLRATAVSHFAHEETLLDAHRAANAAIQREEHGKFIAMIDQAENACSDEGENPAAGFAGMTLTLVSWLTDHIGKVDYDSFRKGHWPSRAFSAASSATEVDELIRRTGIDSIDEDHRGFIELSFRKLGELEAPGDEGPDSRAAASAAVGELARFALSHFAHEERILAQEPTICAERLVIRHREEHRELAAALSGLEADAREGRLGVSTALRAKLFSWWISHTNGTDVETFGSALDVAEGTR